MIVKYFAVEPAFIYPHNLRFIKLAYEPTPKIARALQNIEAKSDRIYVFAAPVGAGETWGANSWGDYFPREQLIKNAYTFEKYANIYIGHNNSSHEYAVGKVLVSEFNNDTDRVDVLFEINLHLLNERAPDWAKNAVKNFVEQGSFIKLSMGCKAEYDVCSVCGKINKSRNEYCDHLKYYMNEFYDGKPVYAITYNPLFFDLSIVKNPADPVAFGFKTNITKTASLDLEKTNPMKPKIRFGSLASIGSLYYNNDEFWKVAEYYAKRIGVEDFLKASKIAGILLSYREINRLIGETPKTNLDVDLKYFEPNERLIKIAIALQDYQGLRPPKPSGKLLKAVTQAWADYAALVPTKVLALKQYRPDQDVFYKIASTHPFAYLDVVNYYDNRSSLRPILELFGLKTKTY